jgi:hypothetical protein
MNQYTIKVKQEIPPNEEGKYSRSESVFEMKFFAGELPVSFLQSILTAILALKTEVGKKSTVVVK